MPEYRQNPLTREWVLLSCERQSRPSEFLDQPPRREESACPFCLGNERETPEEIARYLHTSAQDPWLVRVVPNKYPALNGGETLDLHPGPLPKGEGSREPLFKGEGSCRSDRLLRTAPALGEHEVIIESPRHVASLTELTVLETELLFEAYRDRVRAHRAAGKFPLVQIFKNVGSLAGASIEHSHSQLLALSQVPQNISREVTMGAEYQEKHGMSLLGALLDQELTAGERFVSQSNSFAAWCPFASRFPYEVCVAPRGQNRAFADLEAGEVGELARLVREIIGRIECVLGPTSYNYYLRLAPFDTAKPAQYDWHIEIFPRLVKVAAFEWGTGIFVNTVSPEAAAQRLRSSP